MYVVAIFALALLSPLPFVTPFAYDVQSVAAQTPFGTGETNDTSMPDPIPPDTSPIEPQNEAPPTGTLTSSSNNVNNPAYAKAGDTITVTFTADGTLHYNATATIHGRSAAVSIFENILNASITVLESDADGYANFEINTSNNLGTTSLSETNLIDDAVFVDKHVPVINIHGPHLVYVTQGESYVEPGVSVIDADPNYSDILSDTSSAITTNTVGTYTIVYTALADGAGNVPFTKTRTVSVLGSSFTLLLLDVRVPVGGASFWGSIGEVSGGIGSGILVSFVSPVPKGVWAATLWTSYANGVTNGKGDNNASANIATTYMCAIHYSEYISIFKQNFIVLLSHIVRYKTTISEFKKNEN